MLRIELRQKFRSNGLIDEVVVFGTPEEYLQFAELVNTAINSTEPIFLESDSLVRIEISQSEYSEELFTSLQNENDEYFSMQDWAARDILRVKGSDAVLRKLSAFLVDLSGRGIGYSYISEFSESSSYLNHSPEWRLHVESTESPRVH